MALPVGSRAPDFTLQRCTSRPLSLRELSGLPIALVFVPSVSDPVSREQLTLYETFLPEMKELCAHVIGISTDLSKNQEAFATETGITYPLLADASPCGAVARLYGVYREREEACARAVFVLDRETDIYFSQVYLDLLNPGVDDILTAFEAMR